MLIQRSFLIGLVFSAWLPWVALAGLHHDLDVSLNPDTGNIEVRDTVTLPQGHPPSLTFSLHPALQIRLLGDEAKLSEVTPNRFSHPGKSEPSHSISPRVYRVDLAAGQDRFTVHYSGAITHALKNQGEEYARSFQQTPGIIAAEGVFLSGTSAWYPQVDDGLISYNLKVRLPDGWKSMSQGEAIDSLSSSVEHWRALTPQEEIYLIAGPFTAYSSVDRGVTAMVLLREADAALAQKYLDHTHQYIALYSELIGPYPFRKFALVENFWETGYGMPSFTLLGSRVIRLPFILYSSYPHEILHNWWGNSVYIDYSSGNWAEGLTSYLADHLIKEQRGRAGEYRRDTLQKYSDYVSSAGDFPLTDFRGRHSARTEAVGYGKTLMLFHMLRLQLGDEAFKQGLQELYRQQRFKVAGYEDVQHSFDAVAGEPLAGFFQQWVQRNGAPQLRVSKARAEAGGPPYRLTVVIEQVQAGPAYRLNVPVAVHLHGVDQAYQTTVSLRNKQQTITLELNQRPLRFEIDPEFDVFRRLHRNEIPPAVSQAMGAGQVVVVLPDRAEPEMLKAYRTLAERWQQARPGQVEVVSDADITALSVDKAVWLFGWQNRFRPELNAALEVYDFDQIGDGVRIAGIALSPETHSVAVLGRQPNAPDHALGWLAADSAIAVAGLGRKLPHYGRYSYLGFTGTEPNNVLKGQWPVVDSPLSVSIEQPDGAAPGPAKASLAPRTALAAAAEQFSVDRMRSDIEYLSAARMAGRGLGTLELDQAADYIARQFEAAGLQPGGDNGSYFQTWQQQVDELDASVLMKNVVAILPGSDPGYAGQSLVVGAHYDHLGQGEHGAYKEARGKIHPGADDNASGIAVMLEMARSLKAKPLPRTVIFVAFTAEETRLLGSRRYVAHADDFPVGSTIAMLNLDTVGRLHKQPLILFGTATADEWVHIFRGAGYVTGVEVKSVPDDFGSSDQTAFIEAGVPAVQFFAGHHDDFHRPGDTADKIDYPGLTKVARVLNETVRYLGERPERLHSNLAGTRDAAQPGPSSARRVSFGTVPDFTYTGEGVRLDDVRSGTPAAQSGLRRGDIIIAVNGSPVSGMRTYSNALQKLAPGDQIHVRFLRDGIEKTLDTQVTER